MREVGAALEALTRLSVACWETDPDVGWVDGGCGFGDWGLDSDFEKHPQRKLILGCPMRGY